MAEVPVVQILHKHNTFSQALVSLPDELPLPPLAASSLRVRTDVFSLTSNNFTYAKLGSLFGWWGFHPLPPSTPEPYNNHSLYGRTNCWGYARVLESTFPSVPEGSYLFGYLPIGTLPLDLHVKPGRTPGWLVEDSPHRVKMMALYNDYKVYTGDAASAIAARASRRDDGLALDALLGVMHGIAYLLNNFVFPQDPRLLCHPSPGDPKTSPPWTFPEQADLGGATVLVFAPGSKTAVVFAHLVRHQRREGTRPRQVVGVTSESSRPFVVTTGLYDDVALAGENPLDVVGHRLGLDNADADANAGNKIVVIDFGGRGNAAAHWVAALKAKYKSVVYLGVGGAISEPGEDPAKLVEGAKQLAKLGCVRANTDDIRARAITVLGAGSEGQYLADSARSWEAVQDKGIRGFAVQWGQGMDAVRDGWDSLARGDVLPEVGLAFKL
ncbi:DUF2855 family protein [Microdochium nivale]|nr:DUF2855 family protein [Microdochium nivale]